jgi:hypothetical protein
MLSRVRLRLGAVLATTILIGGLAAACSTSSSGQASSTGGKAPPSASLPPCISLSATNCDKSKLLASGRGSSGCVGKGPGMITASPNAIDDIAYIDPMGRMIGGHVTPIDHGAFYVKGALAHPPHDVPVFAPMDGNISSVTRTVRQGDSGHTRASTYDDYAVTIEATCTFRVRYSNMLRFGGGLGSTIGQLQANETKLPNYAVKSGELIGYTGQPTANGIDVWVENDDVNLPGFIDPAEYTAGEVWKTHMVDLFDYTQEPLRDQLLALMERDAAPRFGKIDYDVLGELVGNWFRVGSGGYSGFAHMGDAYWVGHLSVVYDCYDPGQIMISFGSYQGTARQFAVVGNSPDPAGVTPSSGLVRYQLGQVEYYSATTGLSWDHYSYMAHVRTRAGTAVMGTVLMQLLDAHSLEIEIFPGQRAVQVSGFDSGAVMYER